MKNEMTALVVLAVWLTAGIANAAGFVWNENFRILTPATRDVDDAQNIAEAVLASSEQHRRTISTDWFGESLPSGVGRTIVNINFSDDDADSAMTWAKDRQDRSFHTIYLNVHRKNLNAALAHEIAHAVLATRFPHPNRLAPWAEEGIACQYDDLSRKQSRAAIIKWCVSTGNWPRLTSVLSSTSITSDAMESYAVAESLTNFLVSKAGRPTFIAFAETGTRIDWDSAVGRHYGFSSVTELESEWRKWETDAQKTAARQTHSQSQISFVARKH